ncbi:MAG: hypothetical protein NUV46_01210 [Nanoarchaeota archaeon]|nr:hypothetical protein [Nanoarchaeota archaeon]
MNEHYYLIKYKWGPGGVGVALLVNGDKSEILVGRGHINKESDLELRVKKGIIISISEDYTYKKIDIKRVEALKRKEEKYLEE